MESIKRVVRQAGFIVEEAVVSFTRAGWMSWVVIITMAVSLSILGGFWLLSDDLNSLASKVGSKVEVMVFLRDGADPAEAAATIKGLEGVSDVELIPKDDAWKQLQHDMRSQVRFDELVANPLPDTLRIKMSDSDQTPVVAEIVAKRPDVEDVNYGRDLLAKIQEAAGVLKLAGILITSLLFLATLAVIGNTIRLAVQNRRREIEIMQLVGASHAFIHWPFLLEGLLFGIFGAILSGGVLAGWRVFVLGKLQELFPFIPLEMSHLSTMRIVGYLALIGMGIGALGSMVSVKRHLTRSSS